MLIIIYIIIQIVFLLFLLISIAYLTLAERKILGAIQLRKGPQVVGLFGLLQPLADGAKLLFKEFIFPRNSNKKLFFISPLVSFAISLYIWVVIPINPFYALGMLKYNSLFLLAFSSLNVYGIVLAGWSSNSKYALLGAIRSAAQMISYEVSLSIILLFLFIVSGSLNLLDIIGMQIKVWFIVPFAPLAIMCFISMLAETNRTPFDLPEAEAELVAGYNVEYSAMSFAMFFLAEYSAMISMSLLFSCLFLGGHYSIVGNNHMTLWLACKSMFILYLFILVRGTLPRYRYDQLMYIGWQVFLPLSFVALSIFCFVCFFIQ